MTSEDIKLQPIEIDFEGEKLNLEYDNTSIAYVETKTGKGIFKLKNLIFANNLTLQDSVQVFVAALIKHHDNETVERIGKKLSENIYLLPRYNQDIVDAFMKPHYAPEIYKRIVENEAKIPEKKSPKKDPKV
ncbi:MAG: hypothetical protein WCY19_05005 [Candidatus Gastranaerophilaceae bacterium]